MKQSPLTSREAATRLGVNASRIRQLILEGRLPARKLGRDWAISHADLARFEAARKSEKS